MTVAQEVELIDVYLKTIDRIKVPSKTNDFELAYLMLRIQGAVDEFMNEVLNGTDDQYHEDRLIDKAGDILMYVALIANRYNLNFRNICTMNAYEIEAEDYFNNIFREVAESYTSNLAINIDSIEKFLIHVCSDLVDWIINKMPTVDISEIIEYSQNKIAEDSGELKVLR